MIDKLLHSATQTDFYKAVFIIESQLQESAQQYRKVGYDSHPKLELIRFSATQKFGFAGNAITNLKSSGTYEGATKFNMEVSFMGMTGCSGALPHFYSELVMQRLRFKDTTMRDFYDMFNHRLVSLYYRAWKKYKPTLNFANKEHDQHTKILSLLSGGRAPHQLYFGGLFSRRARNAADLRNILAFYLDCDVEIAQFVGQWQPLKQSEQTQITSTGFNAKHARLGVDAMAGKQVWDISTKVKVIVKPKDAKQTTRLLPRRDLYDLAHKITKDFLGNQVQHELVIKSNFYELDATQLKEERFQLGCNSFLLPQSGVRKGNVTELSFKG
ncbi:MULTISPECIES: type VI secretion system baseplate subunit TssG [Pseudoalteromonas]|uniref:type VI secretion system baseplate subunit TssG n=1 Tax=Pseudoalteromonas TaxID=53246 RepID=UPI000784AAD6|nr:MULTISPECIES: type VI secretion system baseplate subunit TssG [Pseudoalteromonas]MCF7517645.1 type VI secretion system baseplate subunit TssG [Pseudoalteromonas sp. L21]RZF90077.1 type VI secretion system baseplate subunit TssG [Pseudoalteromonas sp. CO302Y]RZG05877.1 type VI secretion system baseplate subunit TssG [Pseudoalteromonas sp. CO133X]UJX27473.1 type VI secretion system baseplate subunit TssG [Pseudoalteromonas sp. CF6-2]|tara:strand:- start:3153 stop:4133 length:981 start_codon:yes stop_codon:yes gene_type:complete